ncbi:MAG: hypothetical protein E7610_07555 [Ruminococcaceae bacterium]|nr:hypothetical protein [Oscillospiraceae bacterium]
MKKNLLVARIAVMVIGILAGVLLLVLGAILLPSTVATIIHWGLVIYGIIIIIGNIPGLISGIANVNKSAGVFDLICSILGIGLGVAMIFYQGTVLIALVAAYMIVFPLIRVLLANQKVEQLKRELVRMVLGVVLLVFLPSLLGAAFEIVHLLLVIGGWTVIALSTLFGVIEIIRIALAKETKESEEKRVYVEFEETKN